jgi:RimJ/RimL family protein N-acetyltransferase
MSTILLTPRLHLREFTLADAPFILELVNTSSWLAYIGDRSVHTLAAAEHYIQNGPMRSYAQNGYGLWLVALREGEVPIGMCGLVRRAGLTGPDIGFAFLPSHEGVGYAFEAARSTLAHAEYSLELPPVFAITVPVNVRSIKLLGRLGMQFKETIVLPGETEELMLFVSSADSDAPGAFD